MTTTNRILTQEQAEALYAAAIELQAINAKLDTVLAPAGKSSICAWEKWDSDDVVITRGIKTEQYDNWTAFADAYSVHYGLTSMQPESTIDRMVREAQENFKEYVEGYSDAVLFEVRQGFRDARAALHKRIGLSVTQLARQKVRDLMTAFNQQNDTRFKSIDNTYN